MTTHQPAAAQGAVPALAPLKASISSITLFGETVSLGQIDPYFGEPLFITAASVGADGVLSLTIDDVGPPIAFTLSAAPAAAWAQVTYKGQVVTSLKTVKPIALPGTYPAPATLIITAAALPPSTGKWLFAQVVPAVSVFTTPTGGVEFMMFGVSTTDFEMRWLPAPVLDGATLPPATVIPAATGGGVLGPFGYETP